MKQTNQDQDPKQQGNPDQQKKTGAMQNGKNENPQQHGRSTQDSNKQSGNKSSDWQKDKQSNKK
jgi:hypothetical protein